MTEASRFLNKYEEYSVLQNTFRDGHTVRVGLGSGDLALKIGRPLHEAQRIMIGGITHDSEKVNERIRHLVEREGEITSEERDLVREIHCVEGGKFIQLALKEHYDEESLWHIAAVPFLHHHPFEGAYVKEGCRQALFADKPSPYFLAGKDIPLGARIVAVVDDFDGFVVDIRKHRKNNHTVERGVARLIRLAGKLFDPDIVEAYLRYAHGDRLSWKNRDFWRLKKAVMFSGIKELKRSWTR